MISRRAILAAMGGLPFSRPDQHYEPPAGGAQIPGARGLVRAIKVLISGGGPPGSGLFVYSPSVGAGKLVDSIAAIGGTDGTPGNLVQAGITNYSGPPFIALSMQGGQLQLFTAATEAGPWTLRGSISLDGTNNLNVQSTSAGTAVILTGGSGGSVQSNSPVNVLGNVTGSISVLDVSNASSASVGIMRGTAAAVGDVLYQGRISGDTNARLSVDVAAGGNPRIRFGPGNAAPDVNLTRVNANQLQVLLGDLDVATVGRGLQVAEGTNAKQGTATLAAGTVTVANTAVTANSRIFLTAQTTGAAPGALRVSARTAGTSFVITSTSATDTSLVAYEIFEPG